LLDIDNRLDAPLRYFPLNNRPFRFSAGLRRLRPEQNPDDPAERLLQLDNQWPHYRQTIMRARDEQLDKYVCSERLSLAAARRVTAWLIACLSRTWPRYYQLHNDGHYARLHCVLSGETLYFDPALALVRVETTNTASAQPDYINALDALCSQIQEDVAICEARQDGNAISWLHLCLPNHWAASDKIGRDFIGAHQPVPGMERINQQSATLVNILTNQGPFERFTWGLVTDTRLSHHPDTATQETGPTISAGRHFDRRDPHLYLRVERQVTVGLPEIDTFIFLIRTYLYDVATLDAGQLRQLEHALNTMPAAIRAYKGLAHSAGDIINWLGSITPIKPDPSQHNPSKRLGHRTAGKTPRRTAQPAIRSRKN